MLKRLMTKLSLIAFIASLSVAAHAMADAPKAVDVPAGDLVPALEALEKQADVELVFRSAELKGLKTLGVKGIYEAKDAIRLLLKGTPLELRIDPTGAMLIARPRAKAQSGGKPTVREGSTEGERIQLAQVDTCSTPSAASVEKEASSESSPQVGNESAPEANKGLAEILIKGSRTMNVDVVRTEDDVQPYTIFDSRQIERSGAANVEDFLKQRLTMNTVASTNTQASPTESVSNTISSINLRGLGSNETLILIDGRRSAGVNVGTLLGTSSTGSLGQPDINGIPLSAIERIEVLPASASAIYGGAAVGGVVNIVLKKNFTGGDLQYTYEKPLGSSADDYTVTASYGTSLLSGATRIMVGGSYSDGRPLLLQDRLDLVERGISTILNNSPSFLYDASDPFPGATPNIASALSFGLVPVATPGASCVTATLCFGKQQSNLVLKGGNSALNSTITSIPAGAKPGDDLSNGLLASAGKYNLSLAPGTGLYGLQNPFGTVPLTKSIFATLRQTLFNDAEMFAEFSTSSNSGRTIYNPFYGSFTVPSSASTNPFEEDVSIDFPSSVSSTRTSDSVTHAATMGLIVPLTRGWNSEADYTWSRNSFESTFYTADIGGFNSALAAGTVNPFVDTSEYPLDLVPYLAPSTYSGSGTLSDLSLRMSGPLVTLPTGTPTLTVGAEHRRESAGEADREVIYPQTLVNNVQQVIFGQSQSTDSLYAETVVPLVADKNAVPWVRSLALQVAGRTERYTVEAGTPYVYLSPASLVPFNPVPAHATIRYTSTNPTVGLKYQPGPDVAVRMSYSTAFLPPTPAQLLPNPTPACGGVGACYLIADPKTGTSYNVNYTGGGNPNLQPQKSRDWELGMIWEPQENLIRGVRANIEYYRITQPNYIVASPSIQELVANPAFASRVTRDPTSGLITNVDASALNAAEYKTSGWDVRVSYQKQTGVGDLAFDLASTFIKYDLRQLQVGSPFYEYAGYVQEGGEGKVKSNAVFSWKFRRWSVSWTATYYSGYYQASSPGSPLTLQIGVSTFYTAAQGSYTIPSQIYHDISAAYAFDTSGRGNDMWNSFLSGVSVRLGLRNVFNTLPPFDAATQGYLYSPFGDPRLRSLSISITKEF